MDSKREDTARWVNRGRPSTADHLGDGFTIPAGQTFLISVRKWKFKGPERQNG